MTKWNILANYIGHAWVSLLGLACIPIYINLLGIEAYGIISFIISLQIILTILDLGITISLNREFANLSSCKKTKHMLGTLLRTVEVIFILISVVIFGAFYTFSKIGVNIFNTDLYSDSQLDLFLLIAGILISLRLIEGMYKSCLVGLQKQISVNLLNVISASFRHLGAIFVLITTTCTIDTYLYWQVITSCLTVLLFAIKLYMILPNKNFEKKFSLSTLRPTWRFSLGVMGMSILSLCLTNIDKLLLVKLVPLRAYSEYMLAITFATGLYSLTGPVIQAVFPRLCQLAAENDLERYKSVFHKATQLICVAASSISAVILFNTYDILKLWTQDETLALSVSPLLKMIIIGTLLNCLTWMPYQSLLSFGNSKLILKINLFSVLLIIPSFFVLATSFGSYGAATTWLFFNIFYFLLGATLAISKSIQSDLGEWFFLDTIIPALGAFVCAALIFSIKWFLITQWWQAIMYFTVSLSCVLAVSVFCAAHIRQLVHKTLVDRLNSVIRK